MKKLNTIKRVLAGVLAMLTVAAYMPANVGGFLTGSTELVAKARDSLTSFENVTIFDPRNSYIWGNENAGTFYIQTTDFHENWTAPITVECDDEISCKIISIKRIRDDEEEYFKYFLDLCGETIVLKSSEEIDELDAVLRVKGGDGKTADTAFSFEVIARPAPPHKVTCADGIKVYNGNNEISGNDLATVNENTNLTFVSDKLFALNDTTPATYSEASNSYSIQKSINSDINATFISVQITNSRGMVTYGNSLEEAVEKAESGSTIKLLEDVTINDMPENGLHISGKTLTLDLNGKTLSCKDSRDDDNNIGSLTEEEGKQGNLTITDTSTDKKGIINAFLCSGKNDTLTIKNVKINGGICNHGTATIEGGTFEDDIINDGAITIQDGTFKKCIANTNEENVTMTINGGTFEGDIFNEKTATINGGTFNKCIVNDDTMFIDGGTFKGTALPSEDGEEVRSNYTALFGEVHNSVVNLSTITIKNGTFEKGVVSLDEASIEGGTFKGNVVVANFELEKSTIIKGGTFKKGIANGFKSFDKNCEYGGATTIEGGKFQDDITNTLGTVTLAGGVFVYKPDNATQNKTLADEKKLFKLVKPEQEQGEGQQEQEPVYVYGVGSIGEFTLSGITNSYSNTNYPLTATAPTTGTSIEGYGINFTYQWAKKDTTSGNYVNITGETSNTHNVKDVADSGDYQCTIKSGDNVIQQLQANVDISQSTVPVTAPTAKKDLTFNNTEQELINAGSATDGILYYMIADSKPDDNAAGWKTDASELKGKDAGTYKVWYKAITTDNANRTNFAVVNTPLDVEIKKATIPSGDITPPTPLSNLYYTDKEQNLINKGSVNNGKMQYAVTEIGVNTPPTDWKDTVQGKDAKKYKVWYKATHNDTKNYNATIGSVDVEIKQAQITCDDYTAPTAKNPAYTSSPVQLINAGKAPTGCTMYYMISNTQPALEAIGWDSDVEKITAAGNGTYYVWYKVKGTTNYADLTAQSVKVIVSSNGSSSGNGSSSNNGSSSRLNQTWELKMDSYPYDGTAHEAEITGNVYGKIIYYYYNADTDELLDEAPSEVGNYRVRIYASGSSSYYSRIQTAEYSITNPVDPIDENGMASVEKFKNSDTIPTVEGKIFAGWFTDSTCTTPYTQDSGQAYAKFIDEKILTVKAQISSSTTANSEKTSIRFITSVDSLKYQNVGFKITYNGKTIDKQMTKVYSTLNAGGKKVYPSVFSKDSNYMEAYALNNIPNSAFGEKFTVTPYYTTQDGTIVDGETKTFTIANMIKN